MSVGVYLLTTWSLSHRHIDRCISTPVEHTNKSSKINSSHNSRTHSSRSCECKSRTRSACLRDSGDDSDNIYSDNESLRVSSTNCTSQSARSHTAMVGTGSGGDDGDHSFVYPKPRPVIPNSDCSTRGSVAVVCEHCPNVDDAKSGHVQLLVHIQYDKIR